MPDLIIKGLDQYGNEVEEVVTEAQQRKWQPIVDAMRNATGRTALYIGPEAMKDLMEG